MSHVHRNASRKCYKAVWFVYINRTSQKGFFIILGKHLENITNMYNEFAHIYALELRLLM